MHVRVTVYSHTRSSVSRLWCFASVSLCVHECVSVCLCVCVSHLRPCSTYNLDILHMLQVRRTSTSVGDCVGPANPTTPAPLQPPAPLPNLLSQAWPTPARYQPRFPSRVISCTGSLELEPHDDQEGALHTLNQAFLA
jgi:hypothetical protein